jgi:hypothetical protein
MLTIPKQVVDVNEIYNYVKSYSVMRCVLACELKYFWRAALNYANEVAKLSLSFYLEGSYRIVASAVRYLLEATIAYF